MEESIYKNKGVKYQFHDFVQIFDYICYNENFTPITSNQINILMHLLL